VGSCDMDKQRQVGKGNSKSENWDIKSNG